MSRTEQSAARRLKQRYLDAILNAMKNDGRAIDAFGFPEEIEADFYAPSLKDALNAQVGVLQFLQDTLAMRCDSTQLTSAGTRGLYLVLQAAIDNAARVSAFIEAARAAREWGSATPDDPAPGIQIGE